MRLFHVLPILSLLFGVSASSLDSRTPDAHPLDARDVPDVCASLLNKELALTFEDGDPDDTYVFPIGRFFTDACVCLSGVSQFITTNALAVFAVDYAKSVESPASAAVQTVTDAITDLITSNVPTTCNYPDNSVPMCVDGSPCGFACTGGLTGYPLDNPTQCGCPAPNVVCNGNCVAPGACPSSQVTLKKRWVGSGSCTENGHGWAACGVFGGGARAWECVDTARDLESCGGCVLPLTPFSPIGQDCTAIPGVADVSCLSGECVVRRCMSGYTLSRDGTHCVSKQTHGSRPHVSVPEDDEEYLQAIRYGLEHRPL